MMVRYITSIYHRRAVYLTHNGLDVKKATVVMQQAANNMDQGKRSYSQNHIDAKDVNSKHS
jgi:hypothetical protein